ncbi:MAG TPA: aminotransferase class IV [Bacteroidales bacterium]|nr:aminotransferase class IV [Bacteroidales bacterium]
MFQFIESIRLENGVVHNLNYHQERVNKTFLQIFKMPVNFSLEKIISENKFPKQGLFKIRIVYDSHRQTIEFATYTRPKFHSYKLIEIENDFTYSFKSTDRKFFDTIYQETDKNALPILIQNKNVSDSVFSNLIFEKNGNLYSPNTPLLFGTMLSQSLQQHKINMITIKEDEVKNFDYIYPINAMNPLGAIEKIKI